ncbi:MAG: DUF4271 domain-containing protein [Ekhidna sp.]|nr:DUF4271 domain-containing protein [Ekhidna sp.]
MRLIIIIVSIILSNSSFSQVDTVVIADLKEIMVSVNAKGTANPISDVKTKTAGFFLDKSVEGILKICNKSETYIWLNDRLINTFSSCKFFDIKDLIQNSANKSVYISLYSEKGIENIRCEHVIFDSLPVIEKYHRKPRENREAIDEFLIIGIILISLCFGWVINANPSRINYIFKKSFSIKLSSYEFVNTSFLNQSNFQFLLLISLISGLLFLSGTANLNTESIVVMIARWLKISLFTFLLLCIKWVIASLISYLFRFKNINAFQLFDFQNFLLLGFSMVIFLYFIGFAIYQPLQIFIQNYIEIIMLLILTAYLVWFGAKFISNSFGNKLQIISYLCATEMIPTVLFCIELLK